MGNRTCVQCSADIGEMHGSARFCSTRCRGRRRDLAKRVPCAACGGWAWPSPGSPEPTCRECRRPSCGTVRGYRRGCRCDECKAAKTADQLAYRDRRERRTGARRADYTPLGATCLGCGGSVTGAFKKSAPYHLACRKRIEQGQAKRRRAAGRLERAAAGTAGSEAWPFVSGQCPHCLGTFTRRGRGAYCSGQCRRRDRNTFKISRRDRLAIYERDAWVCQLCLDPVDPDLHYLDDWAASLDHIECQSWALIPNHSPANLRLAHRWCNAVRGNETWHTEADLRGATA